MSEDLDKLDRLAAEKIMGFALTFSTPLTDSQHIGYIGPDPERRQYSIYEWRPTRNVARAWELLEKFDFDYALTYCNSRDHSYEFEFYGGTVAYAETAPLAIVKACLKAKGIE